MTVGFFSPLPPARTGVADYSALLLPALRRRVEIKVNADGNLNLYHIGNNQLHAGIYRRAIERPGVVVLHDAVLHHFALGYFSCESYIEEFVFNFGEWNRSLAAQLWTTRAQSASDTRYFRYPMLKRLLERQKRIIVHNPGAAAIVKQHVPDADVVEIPHLYAPHAQVGIADVERYRHRLTPKPLFGVFGHLRESKRILSILRVMSRIPEAALLLAGEIASRDLRLAIQPWLNSANVVRVGFQDRKDYWCGLHVVDACINLRYPIAGETSGITISSMGIGKPVVMTESAENSRYPEGSCIHIPAGISEEAQLEATIRWLMDHRISARQIGAHAAEYIAEVHAVDRVAALYREALIN